MTPSTDKRYRTMKVWYGTFKKLKMVSAILDESIVSILDRLADAELNKTKVSNEFQQSRYREVLE